MNGDLTVVIPAFNSSKHIAKAITSANQVGAAKIIVVDDGSTDDTAETSKALGCDVISQKNSGAAIARQTGAAAVSTKFTILLDADDSLVEDGVAESLKLAYSSGSWSFIAGATLSMLNGESSLMIPWPEGITTRSLLDRGHSPGPPGAFLWRTSALQSAMGEEPRALRPRYAEDYELLIRGSLMGEVIRHIHVSCEYTVEGGKSAIAPLRSNTSAEDIRRFYARAIKMKIRERSASELQSMAYLRLAYSAPSKSLQRSILFIKAAITTPPFFPGLIFRKLRRIVSGSLLVFCLGHMSWQYMVSLIPDF